MYFLFTSVSASEAAVDGITPRRTVPWNGDQRRPCVTGTLVQTRACCEGGCRTSDNSGGIKTHVSIMGVGGVGERSPFELSVRFIVCVLNALVSAIIRF